MADLLTQRRVRAGSAFSPRKPTSAIDVPKFLRSGSIDGTYLVFDPAAVTDLIAGKKATPAMIDDHAERGDLLVIRNTSPKDREALLYLQLLVDEQMETAIEPVFRDKLRRELSAGLLNVPSGRLVTADADKVQAIDGWNGDPQTYVPDDVVNRDVNEIPFGQYALQGYRVAWSTGEREERVRALLGPDNWKRLRFEHRIGTCGCLMPTFSILAVPMLLLIAWKTGWPWLLLVIGAVAVPTLFLGGLSVFARIAESPTLTLEDEAQRANPQAVLVLTRLSDDAATRPVAAIKMSWSFD